MRRERLSDEIRGQLDAFPIQERASPTAASRPVAHRQSPATMPAASGVFSVSVSIFSVFADNRIAERIELHAMLVDIDFAVERAALFVAGAFERKRERGQRRIGLHAFRIEARHADLRGPREVARLRQRRRDRRRRRRAEREVESSSAGRRRSPSSVPAISRSAAFQWNVVSPSPGYPGADEIVPCRSTLPSGARRLPALLIIAPPCVHAPASRGYRRRRAVGRPA